ncbi:hypothetical protein F442_10321 [Phytophthora nicotianae P10297]|uniref:Uncharacterized protein n=4 Tax=Phytophthora nicotianae TaxID=4792 RepID=W2RAK7_PHYN3|nr:hypothetical protein PPTG_21120 [Phytophthora nicotianae INRA-310]ETI44971.1 hypothetical protein F443_10414 [Phytophthora nicotianae P1569]ETN21734.1 hypothetical protein PPTG_21120 [Phytophthora nicotianae INRA-310]ETO73544.1 hypothetical protein F444_10516 [Phytophthora nicotianae P1976]ETP42793.1 hypothetical protein F442_10321 [Phytophthora nicotianae P10297]
MEYLEQLAHEINMLPSGLNLVRAHRHKEPALERRHPAANLQFGLGVEQKAPQLKSTQQQRV